MAPPYTLHIPVFSFLLLIAFVTCQENGDIIAADGTSHVFSSVRVGIMPINWVEKIHASDRAVYLKTIERTADNITSERAADIKTNYRAVDIKSSDRAADIKSSDRSSSNATGERVTDVKTRDRATDIKSSDRSLDNSTRALDIKSSDRFSNNSTSERAAEFKTSSRAAYINSSDRSSNNSTSERVADIKSSDRSSNNTTGERVGDVKSNDRVADINSSDRVADINSSDRFSTNTTSERVRDVKSSERAANNSSSERAADIKSSKRMENTTVNTDRATREGGQDIPATIRATNCISNTTHCHCSMQLPSASAKCFKLLEGETSRCYAGPCTSGYKCDCNSFDVCKKISTVYYTVSSTPTTDEFDCTAAQKDVPSVVTGYTGDFDVIASQEFQLFVNNVEVGFAESSAYRTFTAEIATGDVIGLIAKRTSEEVYGVKLRFNDVRNEIRMIDENWYASSTYVSNWLDQSFDASAAGWTAPSIATTITEASFDPDVPWMWHGSSETVYFRYVIV